MRIGLLFLLLAATTARAQEALPTAPPAAPSLDPPTAPATNDTEAPLVLDVSIAADNPRSAPLITVSLQDNVGVESAVAWWRVEGQTWKSVPFVGSGPLYLARLPDGPQTTGFSVWIEIKDAAGNVRRVGAEAAPLEVAAAVEGNNERVARQAAADAAFAGPHPAWVMVALGSGIAATAGAGVFLYDLSVLNKRSEQVDRLLADEAISASRRAELEETRVDLDKAITQDQAVMGTLAVLGGVALVTGVALLTVSALEQ